jgi:hypothetical protein
VHDHVNTPNRDDQPHRSLQEHLDSRIARRSNLDALPLDDVDRVVSRVPVVKFGGDTYVVVDERRWGKVMKDWVSSWETRMEVSIPSVQLNVSPVPILEILVLETYELLRKAPMVPGSR